jgi:hypothetical protein
MDNMINYWSDKAWLSGSPGASVEGETLLVCVFVRTWVVVNWDFQHTWPWATLTFDTSVNLRDPMTSDLRMTSDLLTCDTSVWPMPPPGPHVIFPPPPLDRDDLMAWIWPCMKLFVPTIAWLYIHIMPCPVVACLTADLKYFYIPGYFLSWPVSGSGLYIYSTILSPPASPRISSTSTSPATSCPGLSRLSLYIYIYLLGACDLHLPFILAYIYMSGGRWRRKSISR